MRAAWIIAVKDLALRLRDRSVIIIGVVAPFALAFIFNLVFGGGVSDVGEQITLDMGVVALDEGPIGEAFTGVLDSLVADGLIVLQTYESVETARQAADGGDVGAAFVLPEDLSTSVLSGGATQIEVIGNVDAPTTTDIAAAIARQFSAGVTRANLAAVTALAAGAIDVSELQQAALDASSASPLVEVGQIDTATRQLDSSTYFVAGLSVFFMFFVAGLSVTDMLEERREGTLARLMVAPIHRGSIVAGKSLTSIMIGLLSMTVLVVASRVLMGAHWGPPLGVALLVLAAVGAVVAIMTLVGGLARTPEQAGNLQSIVAVTFAMLGGTFVPISAGQGLLSQLQFVTPNAWFLRGLGDLAGGGVSAALPAVAVLTAMAVLAGGVGVILVKKVVHL